MESEKTSYIDGTSGVEVAQLTDYKGHSHHIYFTNPGWYENGQKLLFSSDRNNRTNLYGVDLQTGEIEQLTDLEPVPMPRPLEFFLTSKNPVFDEAYFWHDLTLMAIDLATHKTRKLFILEPGLCPLMTNCSSDGRYVFSGMRRDLSDQIRTDLNRGVGSRETWEAKPRSQIIRVAVDSGAAQVIFEEDYWINHINTSPTKADILTFCHAGPWDLVDNRIWGMDASTEKVWKIRPTAKGEIVGHEYWFKDGIHIGYHGHASDGKPMLGRIRFDNTMPHECDFPGETGHIFSLDDKLVVGDGAGVIRVWKKEGESYSRPRVLCRHDSTLHIQQTHPHPRISPDGSYVVFSSVRSGYGNVYSVPLAEFESLPLADQ